MKPATTTIQGDLRNGRLTIVCLENTTVGLGLKKNIVRFRFPTDPIKTCATQIYLMDFPPPQKKIFFFFFKEFHKLRDKLRYEKERGLKASKNNKSLRSVQIRHAWK